MGDKDHTYAFGRRLFLAGTGALALMSGSGASASAQESAGGKPAPIPGKQLRQILAEFVVAFDLKQVPPEIVELARLAFIDTVGVAVAGSHEEVAHIAAGMVKLEGTAPQCTIIGQSFKASPQLAALANGVSSHAMDYDFSYVSGQSAAPVIPALLALAESDGRNARRISGGLHRRLRGCRTHRAVNSAHQQRRRLAGSGRHRRHRRCGGLRQADEASGRAGGACHRHQRLAGLGIAGQLRHDDQAAACRQRRAQRRDGGDAREQGLHVQPYGSRRRQRLLRKLRTRSENRLCAVQGYRQPLGPEGDRLQHQILPLRRPRPHRDRCRTPVARQGRGRTNEITNIHCWMSPSSAKRVVTKYPIDVESAKFSASYVVAYSLLYGAPKIKAFTQEALNDARIKALAGLVTASADPQLSDEWGNPTRVKITLKDGGTFQEQRDYPDRLDAVAVDQGAGRGEVHGLRDADHQRGRREEALRHREHHHRPAVLRRFLVAAPGRHEHVARRLPR